jgi:DNA-binding XRE family transcriptional regulator
MCQDARVNDVAISAERERLGALKRWVSLGSDVLTEAQQRLGYTNERMGRELGVHEHTWRRWKKGGRVPAGDVRNVARVLNLEVEEPEPVRASVDPHAELRQVVREELEAALGDVDDLLHDLLARLEPPPDNPAGREAT